mgnify:CR=1 FL=1
MARIKDIALDGTLTGVEKLVSTDADLSTKNITVDTLKQFILTGQGTALTFPSTTGSAGQVLVSQGSSVLDWGGFSALTTTGTSGASVVTGSSLNIPNYTITLTTTGTSGVATLSTGTLNIPDYGSAVTTLNSAQIFVGNASNVSTGVAMSGDVTISNTEATTVGTINSIAVATVTNGAAAGAVALPLAGGTMSGAIAGNQNIVAKKPTVVDTNTAITLQDNVHEGVFLFSNSGSTVTITIDPASSEPFADGTEIKIMRGGAGALSVAPGSGVSLNGGSGSISISAQYGTITLKAISTDTWVAYV